MREKPGYITLPHARLPPSLLSTNAWMTSQLNVTLIRKQRGSLMCLDYCLTCYAWVFLQPGTGCRPVDWRWTVLYDWNGEGGRISKLQISATLLCNNNGSFLAGNLLCLLATDGQTWGSAKHLQRDIRAIIPAFPRGAPYITLFQTYIPHLTSYPLLITRVLSLSRVAQESARRLSWPRLSGYTHIRVYLEFGLSFIVTFSDTFSLSRD